jgi:hypothetical protein
MSINVKLGSQSGMRKRPFEAGSATMIIPQGTDIQVDIHGQLNIRTPGNLVIENSGHFGVIESLNGSIRIEPDAVVEAVQVQCANVCYIQGSLTAWKVSARSLQLENQARASIVLQETEELSIGKGAQLVGNFPSEKELFVLFSRFADQLRSLPLFSKQSSSRQVEAVSADGEVLVESTAQVVSTGIQEEENSTEPRRRDLPDPLFFALILLEREFSRSAYGPTSQRVIEELIKLLQARDLEALGLTYKTLCGRLVEPGRDLRRAYDLMQGYFEQS